MIYCIKKKGLQVHAYVIMSNHVHTIFSAKEGFQLSNIIRDFKKFTSKTIINNLIRNNKESRREWILRLLKYHAKYNKNNKTFQFWRFGNRPIELTSPKFTNQKLAYIHLNPVKAGLDGKAEDYIYSSARQYLGRDGLVPIIDILVNNTIGYIK